LHAKAVSLFARDHFGDAAHHRSNVTFQLISNPASLGVLCGEGEGLLRADSVEKVARPER